MNNARRQERERRLAEKFPAPAAATFEMPGNFAEQALRSLAHPLPVELRERGTRYVTVDAAEVAGAPAHEEVRVRFRLLDEPVDPILRWGGLHEPVTGTEPVYYFTLRSDVSIAENLADLRAFVAEHLEDEPASAFGVWARGVLPDLAAIALIPVAVVGVIFTSLSWFVPAITVSVLELVLALANAPRIIRFVGAWLGDEKFARRPSWRRRTTGL